MPPVFDPALPATSVGTRSARPSPRWRARWPFVVGLALSLGLHVAASLWPGGGTDAPETPPLQATIATLPPPPVAVAPPPHAKPKPKRAAAARPRPMQIPAPLQAIEPAAEARAAPELLEPPRMTEAPADEAPPPAALAATEERELPPPLLDVGSKTLPPRVDLAYRVFWGTQGFFIGEATYRLEHSGNRYRIASVGEARGLAALILRGQGKIESEGLITAAGLQPEEFALERGKGRKREVAQFDWEAGVVNLDNDKTEGLELPTYDPLAFLWQFYFLPPSTDEQTFAIATTRKVYRYTFKREDKETIELPSGSVETERWHRTSEDGKTDAYVWLAPGLHFVAVKLRFANTERGTVEALLDAIRVDEAEAAKLE